MRIFNLRYFSFLLLVVFVTSAYSYAQGQWRRLNLNTQVNLNGITRTEDGKTFIAGNNGRIFKRLADSMDNFETVESGTTSNLKSISFHSAPATQGRHGAAVGSGGTIIVTTNGGTSWNSVSSGTTSDLNKVFFGYCPSTKESWAHAVGDNSMALTTRDSGDTWQRQSTPYQYDHLYAVHFSDNFEGWIAGSTGILYNTSDSGSGWNYVTGDPANPNFYGIYFVSFNIGWACGSNGKIIKTSNHGSTWTQQNSGSTNILRDIEFCNPDSGMAVGDRGTLILTTNGGNNWQSVNSGTTANLTDALYDSVNYSIVVGDSGTVITNRPAKVVKTNFYKGLPKSIELFPAYPNPFNAGTRIKYSLSERTVVNLSIYDILGRKTAELENNQVKSAGIYNSYWNGSGASSGMYIIVLQTNKLVKTEKIILLK